MFKTDGAGALKEPNLSAHVFQSARRKPYALGVSELKPSLKRQKNCWAKCARLAVLITGRHDDLRGGDIDLLIESEPAALIETRPYHEYT